MPPLSHTFAWLYHPTTRATVFLQPTAFGCVQEFEVVKKFSIVDGVGGCFRVVLRARTTSHRYARSTNRISSLKGFEPQLEWCILAVLREAQPTLQRTNRESHVAFFLTANGDREHPVLGRLAKIESSQRSLDSNHVQMYQVLNRLGSLSSPSGTARHRCTCDLHWVMSECISVSDELGHNRTMVSLTG